MIHASIDLGTNTCLLLIAEWDENRKKVIRPIEDISKIVRLGEGVDQNQLLQPQAMERTIQCLKSYAQKIKKYQIEPLQVTCVATSQARDSKNAQEFFSKIIREIGFNFRVLSGEEEANYTFKGSLFPETRADQAWVIDIGGGSTEIISQKEGKSIDVGSVRFTERFLKSNPVTDEEYWSCQDAIDQALNTFIAWREQSREISELIAVAGTATSLAACYLNLREFDAPKVDQAILKRGDVHRLVEELRWRTVEERCQLPCMEPRRADVILAGAQILWRAMEKLDFSQCRISSRGLRYGILGGLPESKVS